MHPNLYVALIHYPVMDKHGMVVSTSVTNLDIHDIARAARTYGVQAYYLVTPVEAHHWLARRIIHHWEQGWGANYNPNRKDALGVVEVKADLGEVQDAITAQCGRPPVWVATSARQYPNTVSFTALREKLWSGDGDPYCLLLGTGHGLHPELVLEANLILEPIRGGTPYNHLSVRSAASIILDRLMAADRPTADVESPRPGDCGADPTKPRGK